MKRDERASDAADSPLPDESLLDLLDALVDSRGKVAAAEALGVNYRTMVTCYESRHVSRRMRKALRGFQDAGGDDEGDGDGVVEDDRSVLLKRAAELEKENRELLELVEAQGKRIVELERGVEGLVEGEQQWGEAGDSEADDVQRVPVETSDVNAKQPTRITDGVEGPGEGEEHPGEADAVGDGNDGIQRWRPPGVITGFPTPAWSRWRNSPTRSTPSALRRRWLRSGAGCGPARRIRAVESLGLRRTCAGGSWKSPCSETTD